jgi:molybdate transport system substrate-binding protein
MRTLLFLIATAWASTVRPAERTTLSVAAAANLKPALAELAAAFQRERPDVDVVATYGASGALLAQLENGAPHDLFLSADREFPARLVAAGLARDEVVYALGTLVLWVPGGTPIDVERRGLAALADPAVRKVAIANPRVAPYGRAAEGALRAAGLEAAVAPKLVLGESVAQAAQFAATGAVDAALLPRSLALTPELARRGRAFPVKGAEVAQSAVVLVKARRADLASEFLAFLRGPTARAILEKHGYAVP